MGGPEGGSSSCHKVKERGAAGHSGTGEGKAADQSPSPGLWVLPHCGGGFSQDGGLLTDVLILKGARVCGHDFALRREFSSSHSHHIIQSLTD